MYIDITARDCGPPPDIVRAVRETTLSTVYTSSVMYTCIEGYWFHNKAFTHNITCAEDGVWEGDTKACEGNGTSYHDIPPNSPNEAT